MVGQLLVPPTGCHRAAGWLPTASLVVVAQRGLPVLGRHGSPDRQLPIGPRDPPDYLGTPSLPRQKGEP